MIVQMLLYGFFFSAAFASKAEDIYVSNLNLMIATYLLVLLLSAETTPKIFDLEIAMRKFVDVFQKVYETKVDWTDMWSEDSKRKDLSHLKKFQVSVQRGPITIGELSASSSTPTLLYANLYDNQANSSQTYTVTHTTIRKEKSSYTVKQGFSLGLEVSGGVGFAETLGLSGSVGLKHERETAQTDSQMKLKTFAVATGVTVPSKKTVKVEWYATTAKKDFVWRRNMTISGHFVMKLVQPLEGYRVLILPVTYLALVNKEMTVVGGRHAHFEASGIFTTITVPESDIYTTDVTNTLRDKTTTIDGRSRFVG